MSELYQSKTDVYVVIRLRDPETCIARLGAFSMDAAGAQLARAIEQYGPNHKVVLEPVEFSSPPNPPPAEKGSDEWYRQEARRNFEEGGVVEIDPEAEPSRGDDKGAYVMAWVWVECEEEEDDGS